MPIEFTSMVFPPKAMDLLLNSVLPRGSCLFQRGQKRRGQYKNDVYQNSRPTDQWLVDIGYQKVSSYFMWII